MSADGCISMQAVINGNTKKIAQTFFASRPSPRGKTTLCDVVAAFWLVILRTAASCEQFCIDAAAAFCQKRPDVTDVWHCEQF